MKRAQILSTTFLTTILYLAGLNSALLATPTEAVENKISPESETSITPSPLPQPLVKKISSSTYQIGHITFNKDTREISLPAFTNITDPDTVIEYLLVHTNGEKVHEALLITEADPTHVNLALKLLRYKESPELFRLLKPDGTPGDTYPDVAEDIRKAARFTVHLTWTKGKTTLSLPATQWIKNRITKKPMPATPWVYNGSYIHHHKFKAKLTGNILTIFPDFGSIANYPGKDRDDDTLWFPHPRVPRQGSKVTVTLKPWKK